MSLRPREASASRVPSGAVNNARFWAGCVALVLLTRLGVSLVVLASGFRAVSDDDFARVVIAQGFAASPTLDPSGTSWLPMPFWWTGSAMMLFGSSLEVARFTALVTSAFGAVLLLVAARWLARSAVGALVGALLGCLVPYGSWLGVATVPDYVAAVLIVVAAASAATPQPRRRLVGALALFVATLCRYEAWPVAGGWVLWTAWDAWRAQPPLDRAGADRPGSRVRLLLLVAALVGGAGPALWLLHGALQHGDAWFFVTRVADYQRSLGRDADLARSAVAGVPWALFSTEPELAVLALGSAWAVWRLRPTYHHGFARPMLLGLALVVFLVAGLLRGAAPTHHPERALLGIWLMAALFVGDSLVALWKCLDVTARWRLAAYFTPVFGLACLSRDWLVRVDAFVDRSQEVSIGLVARSLASDGRVLVDTPDYGFFAVMAALGAPERARPLDDRDPRHPRGTNPFALPSALRRAIEQRGGARWLVVTRAHAKVASRLGAERASTSKFVLFDLDG
ncbi:MAG: hypothetical protein JW940_17860 [Polyangiaceae bacterium]|nr:hypothetical protein [Polyangiaceae bacterium]